MKDFFGFLRQPSEPRPSTKQSSEVRKIWPKEYQPILDSPEITEQQKALLRFIIYLAEKERSSNEPNQKESVKVIWDGGESTDEILNDITTKFESSGSFSFYTPTIADYTVIQWIITDKLTEEYRGCPDLRISTDKSSNHLLLRVNMGSITEISGELEDAFGNEEFPVVVKDRNNIYLNNAANKLQLF